MAFIFLPNADGSFTEGDKQTNPETGVEYIYLDGAWRALGPKIEDEFDTLDDRYVNVSGDTVNGILTLDGRTHFNNELRLYPPASSGTSRIRLMQTEIEGGNTFQFTSHPRAGGALSSSKVHIELKRETEAGGETILRFLPDTPPADHCAVNKTYVDNAIDAIDVGDINLDEALADYLPLTGGTLTGGITLDGAALYVFNSGSETFRVQSNGFCRTMDLFRSERTDGGPALQARQDGTLNAEVRCTGSATFKGSVKKDGKELATEEFVTTNALTGDFLPKSGGELTGTLQFNRGNKDHMQFKISPNSGSDFATNIYSIGNGQMRFRTSHTNQETGNIGSHIVLDPANGSPTTKIYKVVTPTSNDMAVPKNYVDDKVGGGRFYMQSGALYYEAP